MIDLMALALLATAPADGPLSTADCTAYQALAVRDGFVTFDSQLLVPGRRRPHGYHDSKSDPKFQPGPWTTDPAFFMAAREAAQTGGRLNCAWSLAVKVRDHPRDAYNAVSRIHWDETGARGLFFIYAARALRVPSESMRGATSRPKDGPAVLQIGSSAVCSVTRQGEIVVLGDCIGYR